MNKNIWKVSGIYQIKNTFNNKVYIGSTVNLSTRINGHRRQLRLNIHGNKHLQSSYNKYGMDSFEFTVLCRCNEKDLLEKEIYFIEQKESLNPKKGYNKASDVKRNSGYKWGKLSREKLSLSKKGTKIHPATLKALIEANKKRVYKKGHKVSQVTIDKSTDSRCEPVYQYDLKGNFIQEFKHSREACNKLGLYNTNGISAVIRGSRLSYKGFIWSNVFTDKIKPRTPKITGKTQYYIEQYSLDNLFIKRFKSGREAADSLDINYKNIMAATKHNGSYKNYLWKSVKIEP